MKMFTKFSVLTILVGVVVFTCTKLVFALGSTPDLGEAASFGILSSTFTVNTWTIITGDVGYTTAPVTVPTINGALYIPKPTEPGADQAAALANLNGQGSVFDNLKKLHTGDIIFVEDGLGTSLSFVVVAFKSYPSTAIVPEIFFSKDGKSHLNLITCGGVWNKLTKHYPDRLVVFTERVVK